MFGQRLRHLRRASGLTLEQLGRSVGKPSSYLSQLENGHREPRMSTVEELAHALGASAGQLLDPTPPNRRAALELAVTDMQEDPRYQELRLPFLRPGARTEDVALEHLVALWEQLRRDQPLSPPLSPSPSPGRPGIPLGAREANARLRDEMRQPGQLLRGDREGGRGGPRRLRL